MFEGGTLMRRREWRPSHAAAALFVSAALFVLSRRGGADAPPGQFQINGDGTVTDTKTGLVWQQTVSASSYTQFMAVSYCAANSASLPGTGWRLPSYTELQTLVDDTRKFPAIDPTAFPSTPNENFWSSSSYVPPNAGLAWYVGFNVGFGNSDDPYVTYRARCVR
jgi:hypothetical protein